MALPSTAVSGVKSGLIQCFFCGAFGHTYNEGTCRSYNGNGNRTGAHYNDWRKLVNNKMYSFNALYPQKYSLAINHGQRQSRPQASAVEVVDDTTPRAVEVSALDWSSEGFGMASDGEDIPTEYLFDGGATDAVSNDRALFLSYQSLPAPVPIKTAANDSNAVIVGKGQVMVDAEDGSDVVIDDVYYCPKATATIISPGALIARGAMLSMMPNNDYVIQLAGKRILAVHRNRRWFVKAKRRIRGGSSDIPSSTATSCKTHLPS